LGMAHLLVFWIAPLCVLLGVTLWGLGRVWPAAGTWVEGRLGGGVWVGVGALGVALYAACVAFAAVLPVAIDAVESTVASTAAVWARGEPLYTAVDAAGRYSLLYGPLCYAPFTLAVRWFGPEVGSLKAMMVLLNVALLVTLWLVFRTMLRGAGWVVPVGFVAAGLMMKGMSTFMRRGDTALAWAIALSLLAVNLARDRRRRGSFAVVLFLIAGAVAVDIKFTSAFYLLVPYYLFWTLRGRWLAMFFALLVPVVAYLPFLLPGANFMAYVAWLHEAAKHPLSKILFAMNGVGVAILLVPVAAMLWRFYQERPEEARKYVRRQWLLFAYLGVGLAGGMLTGSKLGAGRSHLNPGFIVVAYVAVLVWNKLPAGETVSARTAGRMGVWAALYAVVLVVPAVSQTWDLWRIGPARVGYARAVNADLDGILRAQAGRSVAMGYSETPSADTTVDSLALFAPKLVLAGGPELVDAGAMFDMGLSRLAIPEATVAAIRGCAVGVWLFPKGKEPWGLTNAYAFDLAESFPDRHLVSAEFREAFRERYRVVGTSAFYDEWECK
jgi:hypothetical protein